MKTKKSVSSAGAAPGDVDAFMVELKHPLKTEIEAVRKIILGSSGAIAEAIKWKSPSFRTTEFFATVNLRSVDRVQLIFHRGAKVRKDLKTLEIADPAGLLKWLANDRAIVTLGAGQEIAANADALRAIVGEWIAYV